MTAKLLAAAKRALFALESPLIPGQVNALTAAEIQLICDALDRAEDQIRDEAADETARGFSDEAAEHEQDADAMAALFARLGALA